MRYESGAAFRRALEDRLRTHSLSSGVPLVRLRKVVAFDRFLARIVAEEPDRWILKGGLALQFRLGTRARTTKDLDLLLNLPPSSLDLHQVLVDIALRDLGDWFQFQVARSHTQISPRFPVQSFLDGRRFEAFHLDIGYGDPVLEPPERLSGPALLEFAEIAPAVVPCYPLAQQIAEKVHAYTRPYSSGESTRIKDWVDILLMAEMGRFNAVSLRRALDATFNARETHPLPEHLPPPPTRWAPAFLEMNREIDLDWQTLADASDAVARFIDPILGGQAVGNWDAVRWSWK